MSLCVHEDWLLTPYRLAIHLPTATAVIADVHLGYREARQQSGEAVPLLSVAVQLTPLGRARRRHPFRELVVAGDLFERHVRQDLLDEFLAELGKIDVTFAGLVPGNHDRGWEAFQQRLPIFPDGMTLGRWCVVHGDGDEAAVPLVMGHWHPATRHAGTRCPCYLMGPCQLVLPAFSKDAAGQTVDHGLPFGPLRHVAIAGGRLVDGAAKSPRRQVRGLGSRMGK